MTFYRTDEIALPPCPDCLVSPGTPHIGGCDVERCETCGEQAISCEHDAPAQVWTGAWPFDVDAGIAGRRTLKKAYWPAAVAPLTI